MKYILCLGTTGGSVLLDSAVKELRKKTFLKILGISKIYANNSVSSHLNYLYHNCAIAISASIEPKVLYRELMMLEQSLGRLRPYKNAPRTIDIDIGFSDFGKYEKKGFLIPHKEFFHRNFFLLPTKELMLSLGWIHCVKFNKVKSAWLSSVLRRLNCK